MATTEKSSTTRKPAAKKAPAKAAAKKAAPKKAATTTAGRKIRWAVGQVFANGKNQSGTGHGGTEYGITRKGNGEFTAMVRINGKATELVTGSFSAAYWAAVNHNKTAVDKATATAAKKAAPAAAEKTVA